MLGLFAAITIFALRMAIRTSDSFVRITCVGIVAWIVGQALINLGAVLQLLPDHRRPAAVHLLRWIVAAALVDGRRRAAGLRPAGGRPRRPRRASRPTHRGRGGLRVHVVLAGGGTAGHIEPALNLADALRRRDPEVGITALGTEKGLEGRLVPARGYELRMIPAVPLPRRPSGDLVDAARSGPRGAAPDARGSWPTSGPTSSSASAATSPCRPTSQPAGRGPRW